MLIEFTFHRKETLHFNGASPAFAEVFYAEINRLRMSEGAHITVAQRELAQIGRKLGQLVAAIADGGPAMAMMVEVHRLEARQGELEAQIAAYDAPSKPLIHPALPELYRRKVSELSASLGDPALQDEAAGIIRSLIESITLTPVGNTLAIDLRGELASILSLCSGAQRKAAPADFSVEAFVTQVKMVAGTGFEPVTFRL